MAQLKQDEWPADNERTTTESEVTGLAGESPVPGNAAGDRTGDEASDGTEDDRAFLNNVRPDEATD
jgi:hypothetical protein